MKNWLRQWLGIDGLEDIAAHHHTAIMRIDNYLESREPCGVCGHHRYTKKTPQRHGEIERARKHRRKNNANRTSKYSREI